MASEQAQDVFNKLVGRKFQCDHCGRWTTACFEVYQNFTSDYKEILGFFCSPDCVYVKWPDVELPSGWTFKIC